MKKRIITLTAKTTDGAKITINAYLYNGGYNDNNKRKIKQAVEEIKQTIFQQDIFHNDLTCKLWCYDYKLPCGIWCENASFKNNLKSVKCLICI
ncbi:MAG: hypothetical protein NC485_12225 [Ruminococcus flavefaciens]|nr:hypothetical protein [Ruminococcus flavefaciens]MCM1060085.1 hypothetical protein [Eubacterium sp.]